MSVITPTITTDDPHEYRDQMDLISSYSQGVHLDFSDGIFAPTKLLAIGRAWRREDLVTHAHIMYKNPLVELEDIKKLDADLVVLHAESDNLKECLEQLVMSGVRTGIALLSETSIDVLNDYEDLFEHVLVFGGHLGYQGGEADLSLLEKVRVLHTRYPDVEIGWDGGGNDTNTKRITEAGVNVLNVGGYLKNAKNPKKVYDTLTSLVS